jgi:D-alanyl-D-alanine carboxypeptidase/D-alanyl-D-alanine-endopeptidase (penicillin-binding protein 4)
MIHDAREVKALSRQTSAFAKSSGRRLFLLAAATIGFVVVAGIAGGRSPATARGNPSRAIEAIIEKPVYAHSTWGLMIVDLATGQVLLDQASAKMFVTGSVLKVYASGAALDALGPNHRFETPVYRRGALGGGVLQGDLVLVASGDSSFGLRDQPDGTLAFNSAPEIDHNYADTGLPGAALVPNSHPLAGVDDLAAQVHAAGIRDVRGDVIIDDRLFTTYRGWPDGVIAPIWVNENVVDIIATPTAAGQPAAVDWRPRTAAYRVVSEVTTTAGEAAPLALDSPTPGVIRVRGAVSVSSPPVVSIWHVEDPAAFARTAFIEALGRAGVAVTATATGPNPSALLPPERAYPAADLVARRTSPPLSEYTKVILKTSYNRGADLMVCLLAVKAQSTDCIAGLSRELEVNTRLGASPISTILFDGAGSDERDRSTPADMTRYLRAIGPTSWGAAFRHGLPILGVDGSLAALERDSPAAGKVQAKTGTRVAFTPTGEQGIITALSLAGYANTASGRQVAFATFMRDLPFRTLADLMAAHEELGTLAAAIQQGY